jgi:hypothetical protein
MAGVFARGREGEARVDAAGRHVPRLFQPETVVKDEATERRPVVRQGRGAAGHEGAGLFDEKSVPVRPLLDGRRRGARGQGRVGDDASLRHLPEREDHERHDGRGEWGPEFGH